MTKVKRVVLDVLKPHTPNALEFATALAEQRAGYRVKLTVIEVDEQTETVTVVIEADDIQFEAIAERILAMGGSVHSIDEAEVVSEPVASDVS